MIVRGDRAAAGGVVATACTRATRAGLALLDAGGAAADAAVAATAVMCVTRLGSVCVGGEAAALCHESASGQVAAVNGQGPAPGDPRAITEIRRAGFEAGSIRTATVPAMVGTWVCLLRRFGRKSFEDCIAPALAALDESDSQSYTDTALRCELHAASGRPLDQVDLSAGHRNWRADLGRTFERLVQSERSHPGSRDNRLEAVHACFYQGEIAEQLGDWYAEQGGWLIHRDLAAFRAGVEISPKVDWAEYAVHKCGTWTQGPWVLQCLNMLRSYQPGWSGRSESRDYHALIEAMKLALADRHAFFGDPEFVNVPLDALLSESYCRARATLIEPGRCLPFDLPGQPREPAGSVPAGSRRQPEPGGTVACLAADRYGNLVAMTSSGVGSTAGSGGRTGITHGTRLRAADSSPGHPNSLAPGKRPCVTLSPTIVLRDGRPCMALSVPGGAYQDQAALQVILDRLVPARGATPPTRHGVSPEVFIRQNGSTTEIEVSRDLPETTRLALTNAGHRISLTKLNFFNLGGALLETDRRDRQIIARGPSAGMVGTPGSAR